MMTAVKLRCREISESDIDSIGDLLTGDSSVGSGNTGFVAFVIRARDRFHQASLDMAICLRMKGHRSASCCLFTRTSFTAAKPHYFATYQVGMLIHCSDTMPRSWLRWRKAVTTLLISMLLPTFRLGRS